MSGYKNILVTALAAALVLPVSAQAAKKTITFMELNDLHAHLVPHTDVVADGNGGTKVAMCGGLTRIATLVKQIRAENPDSVLMNIGDTFHGGAEAFFTIGDGDDCGYFGSCSDGGGISIFGNGFGGGFGN